MKLGGSSFNSFHSVHFAHVSSLEYSNHGQKFMLHGNLWLPIDLTKH